MTTSPDDDLTVDLIVLKYQMYFTEFFGPKYAFGVTEVHYYGGAEVNITARVRPAHHSTKGKTTTFTVNMKKVDNWRQNVKLFNFVSEK